MAFEKNEYYNDQENMKDKCEKCLYYHVILKMKDGNTIDGIIENVDPNRIIILVGEDVLDKEDENKEDGQRQYYNYGYPRRRYRRFRRQAFPLTSLAALSLLPYPYVMQPPYPYYQYYPIY